MKLHELQESVSSSPLYHNMNVTTLSLKNLRAWMHGKPLIAHTPHEPDIAPPRKKERVDKSMEHPTLQGTSFTRSRQYARVGANYGGISIEVDRRKITANNRIIPVNYAGGKDGSTFVSHAEGKEAAEEFVVGDVKNFINKIKSIHIIPPKGNMDEYKKPDERTKPNQELEELLSELAKSFPHIRIVDNDKHGRGETRSTKAVDRTAIKRQLDAVMQDLKANNDVASKKARREWDAQDPDDDIGESSPVEKHKWGLSGHMAKIENFENVSAKNLSDQEYATQAKKLVAKGRLIMAAFERIV